MLKQSIRALEAAGHECVLYTSAGPGFLDDTAASTHHLHWYRWSPNRYVRLFNFTLSQLWLMVRLLRYWREPVLIYANTILPFGAGLAGWFMRKPVWYHVHETMFQPPAFTKVLLWVMRKSACRLTFVSGYLQEYHSISNIPQAIVYNAISDEFRAAMSKWTPTSENLRVLMMCSLKKAKGIFEFIELAARMPDLEFSLVISQSQAYIDQFLGKTTCPDNLTIWPVQKNVHPFYANADVLLSLSHPLEWPETFGMTIVEGLCYGLPALVPQVGAPLEIVREGQEGFQRDMRALDTVEAALRRWNSEPALLDQMRTAALRRAEDFRRDRFEEEIVAEAGHAGHDLIFPASKALLPDA